MDEEAPNPVLLSGVTQSLSAEPSEISPLAVENVDFVVGPDGQMVAVRKEAFVWKQFFVGIGVPGIFMVIPFILIIISNSMQLDEDERNDRVTLVSTDGTNYTGTFTLEDDRILDECRINEIQTRYTEYFCSSGEDSRSREIMMWVDGVSESEGVGAWDAESGALTFDDGEDHGASFNMTMTSIDAEASESQHDTDVGDLAGVACMGIPLTGIGLAIFGFATGRKAMGIGALLALAAFPFVSLALVIFAV